MGKWQYFADEEVKGLFPDLVYKLDRARALYGAAIIITSGYRDPNQNEQVGGVQDSAHTTGKAVDIRAPGDAGMREKLSWALGAAGFRRVGAYDLHFHVDVDADKPTPAWWTGKSK